MKAGDLVEYQGKDWRVYKSNRNLRTVILIHWDQSKVEVADDDPEVTLLADPSTWPFVALPRKFESSGRVIKVSRTRSGRTVELSPNRDWTPSDPLRAGGSIFFNPKLKLMLAEILVAAHENGDLSRVPITKGFGSMSLRKKRAAKPQQRSLMAHIMDDDD